MPAHFDAVGFSFAGQSELQQLLSTAQDRAVADGSVIEYASGFTATYRDPSGALLVTYVKGRDELVWLEPSFESEFRVRWRPIGVVPDEDCAFCDLVLAERLAPNDEMIYPFAMRVDSIATDRELIPFGQPAEVRLVGLCDSGNVWPDEDAFHESDEARIDDGPRVARYSSQSFIPSGTFGKSMTAAALAHGIVESVDERQNALTGERFWVARLDTYGGPLDTCWGSRQGEGLAPGAVVRANLWLVGSPLTLRDQPGHVPVLDEG
jgi:hypothetical protein